MISNNMHTRSLPLPQPVSFASVAATIPVSPPGHLIPTGSWTAYFHEPEDVTWTEKSYKLLQELISWESVGTILTELGPHKTTNGLLRIMRGSYSPLWEDKANIRGGSYCLKVSRRNSIDVFKRYLIAAALGICSKDPDNLIVGVTISPKKGFCIIKVWNTNANLFHNASNILLLHEEVNEKDILYRNHTDQRM